MDLLTTNPNKGGSPKKKQYYYVITCENGWQRIHFHNLGLGIFTLPPATQMKSVI